MKITDLKPSDTVTIGGVRKEELAAGINLSMWAALGLMNSEDFTTNPEQKILNTVTLSIKDLGFDEGVPINQVLTAEFCKKWSAEHLEGSVIKLLPAEAGPHHRLQHRVTQPHLRGIPVFWETGVVQPVWIAMQPIKGPDGNMYVFGLFTDSDGFGHLTVAYAMPDILLKPEYEFMFELEKIAE